jgi:hypothetical protein
MWQHAPERIVVQRIVMKQGCRSVEAGQQDD